VHLGTAVLSRCTGFQGHYPHLGDGREGARDDGDGDSGPPITLDGC
jgi:hypothetical protein